MIATTLGTFERAEHGLLVGNECQWAAADFALIGEVGTSY